MGRASRIYLVRGTCRHPAPALLTISEPDRPYPRSSQNPPRHSDERRPTPTTGKEGVPQTCRSRRWTAATGGDRQPRTGEP
jgi:hypothetical protein